MNIYPIFDSTESRSIKERQLQQRAVAIWFTGLSGSGKSSIAIALEHRLSAEGYHCTILDGDNLRHGINSDLDFSTAAREENIRRTAEVCRLMLDCGIIPIVCTISPTEKLRDIARKIISSHNIVEIYISTPLVECEKRDTKGLYRAARIGKICDFTGISAPFEPPQHPHIEIDTTDKSITVCADIIFKTIKPRIIYEL